MSLLPPDQMNDARLSAHHLATTTIRCLDGTLTDFRKPIVANNMFRLLRTWQCTGFFGMVDQPQSGSDIPTSLPQPQTHLGEVKAALDSAYKDVFGDTEIDAAVETMKTVLLHVAHPEMQPEVPEEAKTKTLAFTEKLAAELRYW
jgi:hypothetical protein